jgi:formaldehyde-activating enzyme involved in methanogenesis
VKLLEIQLLSRGESSDSITLTKSFIEARNSDNTSIVMNTLNATVGAINKELRLKPTMTEN